MDTILIVDDEYRIRKLISDYLKKSNYNILEANNGKEALKIFNTNNISLIVLDVMMPEINGWDVCKEIRKSSNVPIIMLTAKSTEEDQLKGFSLKVDDYLSKPFSPKILIAHIDAILRRVNGEENDILKINDLEINISSHTVKINDELIDISYKEFEILVYFVKHKNIVISRERLLNDLWGYDYYGDERIIDTHIKKLRQKLKNVGENLKTVWGVGYKYEE